VNNEKLAFHEDDFSIFPHYYYVRSWKAKKISKVLNLGRKLKSFVQIEVVATAISRQFKVISYFIYHPKKQSQSFFRMILTLLPKRLSLTTLLFSILLLIF
jgi:hypothetical protein